MDARLIIHPPADGPWNMAVDEALLESVAREARPCLRFYQWEPPCVSLGYFQSHAERHKHPSSASAPWVRRITGGGAIVHHREVTYSLTVPDSILPPMQLYRTVHEALRRALADYGIEAQLATAPTLPQGSDIPFLCFLRRAAFDLLIDDHKLVGSAQRRRKKALLQHGSFLLAKSPLAPEIQGLCDLFANVSAEPLFWVESWLHHLAQVLDWHWIGDQLTEKETQQALQLRSSRYSDERWNRRR